MVKKLKKQRKNKVFDFKLVATFLIILLFILIALINPLERNLPNFSSVVTTIEKDNDLKPLPITKLDKPTALGLILEIPVLNFKHGLFPVGDQRNNVNQNPEILPNSVMPGANQGFIIIAAHSGQGKTSFFNRLDQLSSGDKLYLYYQNFKYTYEVNDIFKQDKVGYITLVKEPKVQLILTTCDPNEKNKQLIVVASLVS